MSLCLQLSCQTPLTIFQRSSLYLCGSPGFCLFIEPTSPPSGPIRHCCIEASQSSSCNALSFPPSSTRVPLSTARSRTRSKWFRPPTCRCPAPCQMTLAWIRKLLMCPRVSTWRWYKASSLLASRFSSSSSVTRLLFVVDFAC